jgi:hypothetical protein
MSAQFDFNRFMDGHLTNSFDIGNLLSGLKLFDGVGLNICFFRHLMWKAVGWQTVKGIHIQNLFHSLIFSMDFFFEDVYNMPRIKTVEVSDSILLYF